MLKYTKKIAVIFLIPSDQPYLLGLDCSRKPKFHTLSPAPSDDNEVFKYCTNTSSFWIPILPRMIYYNKNNGELRHVVTGDS